MALDKDRESGAPAPPALAPGSFRQSGGFDSLVSVAAFVALDKFVGLPWAIAGATLWSLKATYTKHRRGQRIGWLLPITTLYLIIRGTVGIITDSRAAYFGISIGTKYAIGAALVVSVLIGRGGLRLFAHRLLPFPDEVRAHPIYRSTWNRLTIVAGAYEIASASSDIWLYQHSSKSGFVLIRILVNWVSAFVALFGGIIYADARLKRIPGFEGLLELAERVLDSPHSRRRMGASEEQLGPLG